MGGWPSNQVGDGRLAFKTGRRWLLSTVVKYLVARSVLNTDTICAKQNSFTQMFGPITGMASIILRCDLVLLVRLSFAVVNSPS